MFTIYMDLAKTKIILLSHNLLQKFEVAEDQACEIKYFLERLEGSQV